MPTTDENINVSKVNLLTFDTQTCYLPGNPEVSAHSKHINPGMNSDNAYCVVLVTILLSARNPLAIRHGISQAPPIIIARATVLLGTP